MKRIVRKANERKTNVEKSSRKISRHKFRFIVWLLFGHCIIFHKTTDKCTSTSERNSFCCHLRCDEWKIHNQFWKLTWCILNKRRPTNTYTVIFNRFDTRTENLMNKKEQTKLFELERECVGFGHQSMCWRIALLNSIWNFWSMWNKKKKQSSHH